MTRLMENHSHLGTFLPLERHTTPVVMLWSFNTGPLGIHRVLRHTIVVVNE